MDERMYHAEDDWLPGSPMCFVVGLVIVVIVAVGLAAVAYVVRRL